MSCDVASATACSARSRSGRSASVVISMPAGGSTGRTTADGTSSATARERSYSANPRRSSHPIASGRAADVGTCSAAFPIPAACPESRRYSSLPMPRRRWSSRTPISAQAPSKSAANT